METRKRSVAKSITYRTAGVIITSLVAFLFTEKAALSVSIGAADTVIKFFAYYFHERTWNKINYGRGKIEYQI